ncbi:hypothetical protein Pmar_PMAR021722, partial [Perkinsus marinus ATCC 50983]
RSPKISSGNPSLSRCVKGLITWTSAVLPVLSRQKSRYKLRSWQKCGMTIMQACIKLFNNNVHQNPINWSSVWAFGIMRVSMRIGEV